MRKESVRFSIIMPAYNVAEFIERSIKSVQTQTFKNYELLIVEDCSTDNGKTLEKIKTFDFDNIRLICNPFNLGLGGARNVGIKEAKGEYIVFLDSDDALYSDIVLEKLDKTIGTKKLDVVYLGSKYIGNRNFNIIPTKLSCTKEYKLCDDIYPNAWSKCWRREFIIDNDILFPEKVIYEDVPFMFLAISKSRTYGIANYITHVYTSGRAGSNSTQREFRQVADTVKCIELLVGIKDIIDIQHIEYLKRRINTEKLKLDTRLEKALNSVFEFNEEAGFNIEGLYESV